MNTIPAIFADIGNLNMEAVTYQVTGMLVVFCCLGFLSLILSISGRVAVRAEERRKAVQEAAAEALRASVSPVQVTPSSVEATPAQVAALAASIYDAAVSSVTPQLIAVLAAAVREEVGHDARILSINPVQGNYAQSGRASIMNSHMPLRN